MNRKLLVAVLIALSTVSAQAVFGADSAGTVATVNGKAIPKARLDRLVSELVAQGREDTPDLRKAATEQLIRSEIVLQAAEKKGLEKKPEVQTEMANARQGILIGAYITDYVKSHPVTDAMLKKEYDDMVKARGDKEYQVRHILVDTEDQAKAIIAGLKKGDKFEDLAKQSKDPGSKDRGGELGWGNPASYVKPFSDAMVKLGKGKYTETPVKTDFGWHVIEVDDIRDWKAPSLDEIKPQLTQRLQQQLVAQHVLELRKQAKVN